MAKVLLWSAFATKRNQACPAEKNFLFLDDDLWLNTNVFGVISDFLLSDERKAFVKELLPKIFA